MFHTTLQLHCQKLFSMIQKLQSFVILVLDYQVSQSILSLPFRYRACMVVAHVVCICGILASVCTSVVEGLFLVT